MKCLSQAEVGQEKLQESAVLSVRISTRYVCQPGLFRNSRFFFEDMNMEFWGHREASPIIIHELIEIF